MFVLKNTNGEIIHYRKNRADLEKDKSASDLNGSIEESEYNEADFLYSDGIFWIKDEHPKIVEEKKKQNIRKSRKTAFEQKTDPLLLKKLENVSSFDDFLTILNDWKSEKDKIRETLR